MDFSWTTFVLEIINFLVLVWILKRFLYKPVMTIVAQRKAAIEKVLNDAKGIQTEAQSLKGQYENRLGDWEREKEKARLTLLETIKAERERLMEGLRASLDQEREKNRVLEVRRLEELKHGMEEEAVDQGGRFAARLLSRFAAPDLEAKIVDLVLEDLPRLPEEKRQTVRAAYREAGSKILVASVYPLSESKRRALTQAMSRLMGTEASCEWSQNPDLIAGLRITVGPWVLRANLEDDLAGFSEAAHESR